MSKRGSNPELFAHENDALTARPQLYFQMLHAVVSVGYVTNRFTLDFT